MVSCLLLQWKMSAGILRNLFLRVFAARRQRASSAENLEKHTGIESRSVDDSVNLPFRIYVYFFS